MIVNAVNNRGGRSLYYYAGVRIRIYIAILKFRHN